VNYFLPLIDTSQPSNQLINGNFDFWQVGTTTTVANTVSTYLADQWYVKNSLGTNGVITYSQNAAGLTGSAFGAKVQITTAPTALQTNGCELYQVLENKDTLLLLDKACSFSIQVKALGNVNQVGIQFYYATSEVKLTNSIGSEQFVSVSTGSFTLCTLANQVLSSSTVTTSGVVGVRIRIADVSSGNNYDLNNGFIVEQAMMNVGPSSASFQRRGSSITQELSMCQRFYQKSYNLATSPGTGAATAGMYTLTASGISAFTQGYIPFKPTMRSTPSMSLYDRAGNGNAFSWYNATATRTDGATTANQGFTNTGVSSTLFGLTPNTAAVALMFHYVADARI